LPVFDKIQNKLERGILGMEIPKDQEMFCDIPKYGSRSANKHLSDFSLDVDSIYLEEESADLRVKYTYSKDAGEYANRDNLRDAVVKTHSDRTFYRIIRLICQKLQEQPLSIGSFPTSKYQFTFSYAPEWSSEPIIDIMYDFDFFDREERFFWDDFPELERIGETYRKIHDPEVAKPLILSTLGLLYSFAVLFWSRGWMLAGCPPLLSDFLTALGWSESSIEYTVLIPPWIFGAFIPSLVVVEYFTDSLASAFTATVVLGLLLSFTVDKAVLFDGSTIQIAAYWIYLGYFGLIALVCLIFFLRALKKAISYALHRKKLQQDFLDAVKQQGRIVYALARLLTLWYQYEHNTDEVPDFIQNLEHQCRDYFEYAQAMEK
jgi:hypothetical protein